MQEIVNQNFGLWCIGGLPSSGETRVGSLLAEKFSPNAILIDPDVIWSKLLDGIGEQPLKSSDISAEMSIITSELAREHGATALRQGKSVIIPTAFMMSCQRTNFENLAEELNVPFHPFWLMTSTEVTVQRAAERKSKWDMGIREPNNRSVVDAYLGDPYDFQQQVEPRWIRIDASHAPEVVMQRMLQHVSAPTADLPTLAELLATPKTESQPVLAA